MRKYSARWATGRHKRPDPHQRPGQWTEFPGQHRRHTNQRAVDQSADRLKRPALAAPIWPDLRRRQRLSESMGHDESIPCLGVRFSQDPAFVFHRTTTILFARLDNWPSSVNDSAAVPYSSARPHTNTRSCDNPVMQGIRKAARSTMPNSRRGNRRWVSVAGIKPI